MLMKVIYSHISPNVRLLVITKILVLISTYSINAILPTQLDIDLILQTHNNYRANVKPPSDSMFKLRWNEEAAIAADKMANKCIFEHDSSQDRAIKNYPDGGGQNLYSTNAPWPTNWDVVISAWQKEVNYFEYGVDGKNFKDVGHYTQLVWGSTKEIGCARSLNCSRFQIYTCNYYPPGNSPPYYEPYHKSNDNVPSCKGCLKNTSCNDNDTLFAGKLLQQCGLFCEDKYINCDELAGSGFCKHFENDCPLSCDARCQGKVISAISTTDDSTNHNLSEIIPNEIIYEVVKDGEVDEKGKDIKPTEPSPNTLPINDSPIRRLFNFFSAK